MCERENKSMGACVKEMDVSMRMRERDRCMCMRE